MNKIVCAQACVCLFSDLGEGKGGGALFAELDVFCITASTLL